MMGGVLGFVFTVDVDVDDDEKIQVDEKEASEGGATTRTSTDSTQYSREPRPDFEERSRAKIREQTGSFIIVQTRNGANQS
jgi:hypothetical protein